MPAGAANIVVNGSFETLNGSPTLANGSWEAVPNGGTRIAGWSVGDPKVDISVDIVTTPYAVQDGLFAIDLAGTPGPGSIFQNLSTVNGQGYTLSFYASSNGSASTMEVFWGGSLLDTVNTPAGTTFQFFSYLVSAAGASTELRFRSTQTDNDGAIVDNVSVNAVPVPPAVWLLASSILGLVGIARRRTAPA
jgi:hypothetical protein